MGDKKDKKQRGKKKLEIKKETIQELDDGLLDQVAGGVCAPSVIPTGAAEEVEQARILTSRGCR
jgi:ribosomal protein S25